MAIQWPALEILKHPDATTYNTEKNPQLVLNQLISEVSSGNFPTGSESFRKILRDTGMVSLWFYLRFICGASGPYERLNPYLHVDMCNFRQRLVEPGTKGAMIVPRSGYKSTVASHGGNSWELIRDPELAIGCTSQVYERAEAFVKQTISNFTENEIHKWLYPEWRKANRTGDELILENRKKRRVEPSLRAITAGGATAGIHVDVFNADDIVGEDLLNTDRSSGADMYRLSSWLHNNLRTLVVSWSKSRVVVVGTRYALDDPYERIMQHSKEHYGFWDATGYPVDPQGEWQTYYRPALQNGESIFPEAYSVEMLEAMAVTDPWLRATQYDNDPLRSGVSDFADYNPQKVEVKWDDNRQDYLLVFSDDGAVWPLAQCDVVQGGDPSGGGKARGPKSSKNAVGVVARTPDDRIAIIEAQSGYVEPTRFFDWIADNEKKNGLLIRSSYVEAVAGFKAVVKLLRTEALRRGVRAPIGIPALGDKETTIRNIFQPFLARNKLYIRDTLYGKVMEELRIFPSPHMDLLDALKIAIFKTHKPANKHTHDDDDYDDEDDMYFGASQSWLRKHKRNVKVGVSPVTGY